MKTIPILFTVFCIVISSCTKQDVVEPQAPPTSAEVSITSSQGGTVTVPNVGTLVIPPHALPTSGTVFLGYTGEEPQSAPNPDALIVGRPITIILPSDSILSSLSLILPKPSTNYSDDELVPFMFDGATYYPAARNITSSDVNVTVDVINWTTTHSFGKHSDVDQQRGSQFLGKVIILFLVFRQSQITTPIGLRAVDVNSSGQMSFSGSEPSAATGQKICLFLHGWTSNPRVWSSMISRLKTETNPRYDSYWVFSYNSALPVSSNASTLVQSLQRSTNGVKVDLVGHSMGGLIGRAALEMHSATAYVNKLIMLGTPHRGSNLAALRATIGQVVTASEGIVGALTYQSVTQGLGDLSPNSSLITILNQTTIAPVPYYCIAGINNSTWWVSREQWLPGPDDGAVTVESATAAPQTIGPPPVTINENNAHGELTKNAAVYLHVKGYLNNSGSGQTNTVSGQVSNAVNSQPLSGASVVISTSPQISVSTNASGDYVIQGVPQGTYQITATKAGFISSTKPVTVANVPATVNFALSPVSSGIGYRIVLEWGATPNDLDAHLKKGNYHVYFGNLGSQASAPFARLDVDDTNGFGPETITIYQHSSDFCRYYVHNYSGDPDIKQSSAVVKLYSGTSLLRTYTVPSSGSGRYWYVFDISTAGSIIDKNYLTNIEPAGPTGIGKRKK